MARSSALMKLNRMQGTGQLSPTKESLGHREASVSPELADAADDPLQLEALCSEA